MKTSNKFEERYKKLNIEQKKAVDTIDGPLLVVAGPGSGKTEILSLRIGRILQETQILPSNILCLTFTESAAVNMRKRLANLIGAEAYRVAIHTFHNFCVEIIQKHPEYFYGGAFFSPADELTQIQVMQEIFTKLPHSHILRSEHPEQGFVYLRDTLKAVGNLKKSGLEAADFLEIVEHNRTVLPKMNAILSESFGDRLNKKDLNKYSEVIEKLEKLSTLPSDFPSSYYIDLPRTIAISLRSSVTQALDGNDTKPLSAWKSKWLKKDDEGNSVFKDTLHLDKMVAIGKIYATYRELLHSRGYYDFDDMILDVLKVLEKNPGLRYEIQEQYQYVLVDEFQDTNDAQMRILQYVTDAEVHEGHPNIMAVGDDDQAVYKFQGAELSNILNFKKMFRDVQVVTMTKNYRSTQDILDIASHIIRKGEERLEKLLPEIEKNLVASNPDLGEGNIEHKEFPTRAHECHYVSREIKKQIDSGKKPEEIAVIARKHWQLEELVPYLQGVGVPIRYEREQNVFAEPHIIQIVKIAKFLASVTDKDRGEADELLPQILAFPFWELKRETIWRLSLAGRRGYTEKTWLEAMLEAEKNGIEEKEAKKVKMIGGFLVDLGARSQIEPLEKIIDEIVGSHVPLAPENEKDEDEVTSIAIKDYISPFRRYYFSNFNFDHARAEYLSFLSSLRVFVGALREYKSGEILGIKDLIEFVELHEKNGITLNDQSPFARLGEAVSLLTAHKAKGMEFETVFVLSCQDDIWAGRGFPNKLVLPANLPIEPAGDTEDDKLRLFYVALTRAKKHLYLTSYQTEEGGESATKLRFLIAEEGEEAVLKKEALRKIYFEVDKTQPEILPEAHEVLTASWLDFHTAPFLGGEKKLLQSLLEDYQMPVTHLNNFLNITKGGPQYFLEQNLLRFPQAKSASGSYGSAIHATLENASLFLKKEGYLPKIDDLLAWFEKFLRKERLSPMDYDLFLARGNEALVLFWQEKQNNFTPKDVVEFNFKEQGVVVSGAHLSGKIDRIVDIGGGAVEVHDYKTGKAKTEWNGNDDYERTKLYEYERQLYYYKFLVENSREFGDKSKVVAGVLEFVEPKNENLCELRLGLEDEDSERLKKLIGIVYSKIMNIDLPDISKYKKDLSGIKEFEEDLLSGRI